jgi:peptidoglycan hydrolase CwlO-like protein
MVKKSLLILVSVLFLGLNAYSQTFGEEVKRTQEQQLQLEVESLRKEVKDFKSEVLGLRTTISTQSKEVDSLRSRVEKLEHPIEGR